MKKRPNFQIHLEFNPFMYNVTTLCMKELKNKDKNFTIKWSVSETASPYTCGTKWCNLCLTEKLLIANADFKKLLNKKSETIWKVVGNAATWRTFQKAQGKFFCHFYVPFFTYFWHLKFTFSLWKVPRSLHFPLL